MTKSEIENVLKLHKLWLNGGQGGMCAKLHGANLQYANLQSANLRGANLQGADLQNADLQNADLRGADLRGADLQGANLRGANLQYADLQNADLQNADLRGADLRGADLQGANLQDADLRHTNLRGADLQYAVLDISQIQALSNMLSIVPEKGQFIAYKAAYCSITFKIVILELKIPATAKRIGGIIGRKCRVSEATVVGASYLDGTIFKGTCRSIYDDEFYYKVGGQVIPDSFDDNPMNQCTHGIHVFINRAEAEAHL